MGRPFSPVELSFCSFLLFSSILGNFLFAPGTFLFCCGFIFLRIFESCRNLLKSKSLCRLWCVPSWKWTCRIINCAGWGNFAIGLSPAFQSWSRCAKGNLPRNFTRTVRRCSFMSARKMRIFSALPKKGTLKRELFAGITLKNT